MLVEAAFSGLFVLARWVVIGPRFYSRFGVQGGFVSFLGLSFPFLSVFNMDDQVFRWVYGLLCVSVEMMSCSFLDTPL